MLSVDRKALLAALETLKTVAPAKSGIPVLSHVSLASDGTSLKLSATDLYRSAWVTVPGDGVGTWSRSVDLRLALDRAKRFRNGHCTIGPAQGGAESLTALCLSEGPRTFKVVGVDPSDAPPLPTEDKARPVLTIGASVLASAIERVIHAVSPDQTRPHLNAIRFEVTWGGNLRLVATDGHRLSLWDTACTGESEQTFLLSLDAVTSLRSLVASKGKRKGAPDESVAMTANDGTVFVKARGVTLALRKVDATFPPYAQVIPATSTRTVTCDRALLAEVIAAIGACASERTGGVKLTLAGDTLRVHTSDPDEGEASETMPVTGGKKGAPFTIGVNHAYLRDALGVSTGDTVTIGVSGELDPIVIRPPEGGITVVMPMRI